MFYGYRHFIVYIKAEDIYKYLAENFETRFDTSSYELGRTLAKAKNKKVIELMRDELGGKIMTKFNRLKAKTYSGSKDKKPKFMKKCVKKSLNLKIIKTFKKEINRGIK